MSSESETALKAYVCLECDCVDTEATCAGDCWACGEALTWGDPVELLSPMGVADWKRELAVKAAKGGQP